MAVAMTCREFIDLLAHYRSAQLPAKERAAFAAHLGECPECVAYLKSYEDTVTLAKGAFQHSGEDVPDEVPEKLVQAILAARRKGN
jgi:anti-sigma factor RsiW